MKKIFYLITILLPVSLTAQTVSKEKLIDMAGGYQKSWDAKDRAGNYEETVLKNLPPELLVTGKFCHEMLKPKCNLLTTEFLTLPDDNSLNYLWMIYEIYGKGENLSEMNTVADSLLNNPLSRQELVENYYSILFGKMINGSKFDMSKINFQLDDYKFKEESDKATFFLVCMNYCGKYIWGYINIAIPMNTKEAIKYINKYPKFNGKKYYYYTALSFPDFNFQLETDKPKVSFKSYYIHKYIEVLLSHALCLRENGAKQSEIDDIFDNSSMKDESLYEYTDYKETLESIYLNRH